MGFASTKSYLPYSPTLTQRDNHLYIIFSGWVCLYVLVLLAHLPFLYQQPSASLWKTGLFSLPTLSLILSTTFRGLVPSAQSAISSCPYLYLIPAFYSYVLPGTVNQDHVPHHHADPKAHQTVDRPHLTSLSSL